MAQREPSADASLEDAVRGLSAEGLQAALAAGANPRHFWEGRWGEGEQTAARHLVQHPRANAFEDRQLACLRLLQEHGGFDAREASVMLHDACRRGCSPAFAQQLLSAGADVSDTFGWGGFSALSQCRRLDTARLLVAAGAPVEQSNVSASLLLALAARRPVEHVRFLLDAGADANAFHFAWGTPLSSALDRAKAACLLPLVTLLLEAGADPTAEHTDWDSSLEALLGVESLLYASAARRQAWSAAAPLVMRAAAWRRRRHMLLAIRGRHRGSGLAPAAAEPTGASALAAAAGAGSVPATSAAAV